MDKTRKAFDEIFHVPDFLDFDGEDYMYYGEDPVLIEQEEDTHALWIGFKAGYNYGK